MSFYDEGDYQMSEWQDQDRQFSQEYEEVREAEAIQEPEECRRYSSARGKAQ